MRTTRGALLYSFVLLEWVANHCTLHIDWLMTDPDGTDCLVEIKSWGSGPSGKDTIKKALADAYYLNSRGDDRPYVLVLTHEPQPTYREMVRQAILDGAIARAIVVTLTDIEL